MSEPMTFCCSSATLVQNCLDAGHTRKRVSCGAGRAREGMSNDKAAQAREGLMDNLAGKAKEVAGAVSGKDDLVEEGQLQQAEARRRKAALADEAIADAKREEATQEMRESNREAAEQKGDAQARAQREESGIERQRDSRARGRVPRGREAGGRGSPGRREGGGRARRVPAP